LRPIYWGLAFTLAGVFSSTTHQMITGYEHMSTSFKPMTFNVAIVFYHYGTAFTLYVALACIAHVAMFFSLPSAIAIEALRERKAGTKED
jgi:hypothetical protein